MSVSDDIEKLIAYNWDIECDSYVSEFGLEEGQDPVEHALAHPENNHIFCTLAKLHVEHSKPKPVVERPLLASSGESKALADQAIDILKGTNAEHHYPIETNENDCHIEIRFKDQDSFLAAIELFQCEENWVVWSEYDYTVGIGLKIDNFGCPCCGGIDVEKHESSYCNGEIQPSGKIRFFMSDIERCDTTCARCGEALDELEVEDDDQ